MRSNWKLLKPWVRALKPARKKLIFGFVFSMLAAFSGIALLALSGWFITASAFAGVLGAGLFVNIYTPGAGIRLFALTRTVGRYFERLIQHDAVLKIQTLWRVKLFKLLTQRDIRWLHGQQTSLLIHRITHNLEVLDLLWLRFITPIATAVLLSLAVVLFIAIWAPWLALGVASTLLLQSVFTIVIPARNSQRLAKIEQQADEVNRQMALDFLEGLPELAVWELDGYYQQRLMKQYKEYAQVRLSRQGTVLFCQSAALVVQQFLVLCTALASAYLWQTQQISGPVAVMLPIAVLALSDLLLPLATQANSWGDIVYAAKQLNGWSEQPRKKAKPAGCLQADAQKATKGLYVAPVFLKQRQRVLLDMPRWHVPLNMHVAVCAASGEGKSTLADYLAGLLHGDNLQVYWQGQAINTLSANERTQRISYLPQRNYIVSGTLWENLRLAKPSLTEHDAWQVLYWVGLDCWVQSLAQKLDTWLGEQGELMSGGQARRLALARVLLTEPELVIFDEPFTGVDPATQILIKNRIQPWLKQRTAIYFAHDTEVLPGTHRQYRLENKIITECAIKGLEYDSNYHSGGL